MDLAAETGGPINLRPLVAAFQSAFSALLSEGSKYSAALKSSEHFLALAESDLKKDPSNRITLAERAEKQNKRKECLASIDSLSLRLAEQLFEAQQKHTESTQNSDLKASQANLKALDDRLKSIEMASSIAQKESQQKMNELQCLVDSQAHEIRSLKRAAEDAQKREAGKKQPPLVEKTPPEPVAKSNASSAEPSLAGSGLSEGLSQLKIEVHDLKRDLADLASEHYDLNASVVETLQTEIPSNVRRAVKLMQDDVNTAAKEAIKIAHGQLAELIKRFTDRYEKRVHRLEGVLVPGTNDDLFDRQSVDRSSANYEGSHADSAGHRSEQFSKRSRVDRQPSFASSTNVINGEERKPPAEAHSLQRP